MDTEQCIRCGKHAVVYDATGSCYVCHKCGYVPDEQGFVSHGEAADQLGEQQEQRGGGLSAAAAAYAAAHAYVRPGGGTSGGGVAGRSGGGGGGGGSYTDARLGAALRSAADPAGHSRARRQRQELDELQALGGTLRLPGPVVRLAAGFLSRIHEAASVQAAAQPAGASQGGGTYGQGPDSESDAGLHLDSHGRGGDGGGDAAAAAAAAADAADDGTFMKAGVLHSEAADAGPDAAAPAAVRVPTLGGQQSAARLGALLYLAARSERGTLTLAEVAAASGTDMFRVGELARQQAAFLSLSLPAVDVERFVMRMALELVTSGNLPGGDAATAGGPQQLGDPGAPALQPPAAAGAAAAEASAPVVLSESALRSHPLVRSAAQLAGLVVRRGWHEGRTPRTVAGALLSICLDALYPPGSASGAGPGAAAGGGGSPISALQLARCSMCGTSQLSNLKQEILGHLTRIASSLPFGPLVGPSNVAAYLDVLVAAEEVMGGMQA